MAVKRVAASIGLKAGDLLLLDTLAAFTQPQDWGHGQRPIVWPSNAYLMDRTGFSLSTVKRHARRLADAGVLTFKDSPNGKRWGHRDAKGLIVEAYGFDLSPMAARAEDLEALADQLAAERAEIARIKRRITITRRTIRARLEAEHFPGISKLWTVFTNLLKCLPKGRPTLAVLGNILDRFETLNQTLTQRISANSDQSDIAEMNPKEANSEPHIQTTNEDKLVIGNADEERETDKSAQKRTGERQSTRIDLQTILKACPGFDQWGRDMGEGIKNWDQFRRAADALGPMVGISQPAMTDAKKKLGPLSAAAALALVFEKVTSGEVASPSGYLRGMIRKAGAGELHLERSFYGRIATQACGSYQ